MAAGGEGGITSGRPLNQIAPQAFDAGFQHSPGGGKGVRRICGVTQRDGSGRREKILRDGLNLREKLERHGINADATATEKGNPNLVFGVGKADGKGFAVKSAGPDRPARRFGEREIVNGDSTPRPKNFTQHDARKLPGSAARRSRCYAYQHWLVSGRQAGKLRPMMDDGA